MTAPPAGAMNDAALDARTIYDIACLREKRADATREDVDFKKLALRNLEAIEALAQAPAEGGQLSMDERMDRLAEIDPGAYVHIRGPIDQYSNSVWEKQSDLYEQMQAVARANGFDSLTHVITALIDSTGGAKGCDDSGEFGVGIAPNPKARYWQERANFWRGQAIALGYDPEATSQPAEGDGAVNYTDIANRVQEATGRSLWPSTVKAVLNEVNYPRPAATAVVPNIGVGVDVSSDGIDVIVVLRDGSVDKIIHHEHHELPTALAAPAEGGQGEAIMRAARDVCAYDWSDNDDDAVEAVARLRALIDSAGGAKGEYTVLRPDGTHYTTDYGGADMALKREGYRVQEKATPQPAEGDGAVACDRDCDCVGECKAGLERTRPAATAQVPDAWAKRALIPLLEAAAAGNLVSMAAGDVLRELRAMLAAAPAAPKGGVVDEAMARRYLAAQKDYIGKVDAAFGRPAAGALHSDDVIGACMAGLTAAQQAEVG